MSRQPWLSRTLLSIAGLSAIACPRDLPAASSDTERDQHFQAIAQVIDREIHLTAERALKDYAARQYPDANGWYADGLRLHYAATFSATVTGEQGGALAKEAEAIRAKLLPQVDKLPALVKSYVQDSGKLRKLALKLMGPGLFNPEAVSPFVPLQPDAVEQLEVRISHLMQQTEEAINEEMKAIVKYDEDVVNKMVDEKPEIVQKAILMRVAWCDSLRYPITVLREVSVRGDKWGISPAFIKEKLEPWAARTLATHADTLSQWEFQYAFMYIPLGHNVAFLNGELVRLLIRRPGLVQQLGLKEVRTTYDGVLTAYLGACDANPEDLPDKAAREWLGRYKLNVWQDLIQWHLALDTPEAAKKGVDLWQDLRSRRDADPGLAVNSPDPAKRERMGAIQIHAARLHKAIGDDATYNALLAEVANPSNKNPYAPNARGWMTQPDSSKRSGWDAQPRPLDPTGAITTARAFLSEAQKTGDEKLKTKFYTDAAATLRAGILGLPENEADPEFVENAPQLYQLYAFTLSRRGWAHKAALVALEGLSRFKPAEWTSGRHKLWLARGGKALSPAGDMVRQLANNALIYSQNLVTRSSDKVASDTLKPAIGYLKVYDPDNVDDTVQFIEIIILMQGKKFAEAKNAAVALAKDAASKKDQVTVLKATRYVVDILNMQLGEIYSAEKPDQAKAAAVDADLNKWVKTLADRTDPNKEVEKGDKKLKLSEIIATMPADHQAVFAKCWQTVHTVQVSRAYNTKRYDDVIRTLDAEFFAKCPKEPELVRRLLTQLCASVYYIHAQNVAEPFNKAAAEVKKKTGSERNAAVLALYDDGMKQLLPRWGLYRKAHRNVAAQLERFPSIAAEADNMRKQLAQAFTIAGSIADGAIREFEARASDEKVAAGLLAGWLGGSTLADIDPELADAAAGGAGGGAADLAVLRTMSLAAKGAFANLYFPIIIVNAENEKPDTIIATADQLWDIGDKERALQLYERYLVYLGNEADLKAYSADPKAAIEAVKAKVAVTNRLQEPWDFASKGSIPDYLLDPPGFMDEYVKADFDPNTHPNSKINYGRAYQTIDEFAAELERMKTQLGDRYEPVMTELNAFRETVKKLALGIKVRLRLIDAYNELRELDKAVAMAESMLQYDPLDRIVVQAYVDGVLASIAAGTPPARDTMLDARNRAVFLRDGAKQDPKAYWAFALQVLELSLAMGEVDVLNQSMAAWGRNLKNPGEELLKAVDAAFQPGRLRDGEGVVQRQGKILGRLGRAEAQLVERYLKLYQFKGAQHRPFVAWEVKNVPDPDDAGTVHSVVFVTINDKSAPPAAPAPKQEGEAQP